MINLNDSIYERKIDYRKSNRNLLFWDRKKQIQSLIQQIRKKKQEQPNTNLLMITQGNENVKSKKKPAKKKNIEQWRVARTYFVSRLSNKPRSKERKKSTVKSTKKWEITIKNPITDVSPVFIRADDSKDDSIDNEVKNTPMIETNDDIFIINQEKVLNPSESKQSRKVLNDSKGRVQINVNILKWKLYNINITNNVQKSPKAKQNLQSPISKSRNLYMTDSGFKKTMFHTAIDETLRNVILKPENYKKFMQNTQDIIDYGVKFSDIQSLSDKHASVPQM